MLTKEQKQNFLGAGALVLILLVITLTSKPEFLFKPKPKPNTTQDVLDVDAYLRYLENLDVDPAASQELFKELITESEIRKEVEGELNVNQGIKPPTVDLSGLPKTQVGGKEAVIDYLAKLTGSSLNFNTQAKILAAAMFTSDTETLGDLKQEQAKVFSGLASLPAPVEASALQVSVMTAMASYGELIQAALLYAQDGSKSPWQSLYEEYLVINEQFTIIEKEIGQLSAKYKIAGLEIQPIYSAVQGDKFALVKTAHAFLGIGDVSITVGDIPRIIKEAVEEGLVASFSQFMGAMLNKLVAKIETNYKIANFLYYTDALVAGQYTDDYLQKYVGEQVDRQIIRRFIPQLSCGKNPKDLKPVFQARAKEYLGFDVQSLQPSDPDYYQKLSRVGDFMASPYGWQQYYEGIAQVAQSEAEKAAERELLSPGIKSPRDTTNSAIAISVNNIVSLTRASLGSLLNLGQSTSKNFISGFVSQLTQNLANKFVFQGVVPSTGVLGVLKEQKVCVSAAQLSPVLPLEMTTYQAPSAPPTQEELLEVECAKYPRGCTVLPN